MNWHCYFIAHGEKWWSLEEHGWVEIPARAGKGILRTGREVPASKRPSGKSIFVEFGAPEDNVTLHCVHNTQKHIPKTGDIVLRQGPWQEGNYGRLWMEWKWIPFSKDAYNKIRDIVKDPSWEPFHPNLKEEDCMGWRKI